MSAPDLSPAACRPRGLLLAWATALALVATSGVQLTRTYADARSGGDQFTPFASDFLAAAAVYEDIFVDHYPMKGFQFSAATFAVPDLLVYMPVRAVAGSPGAAQLPWQACLFACLVLSAWYALAGFAPPRARPWVGPLVIVITSIFMASVSTQFVNVEARDLLLPGCHGGAQLLAFLSSGLLARYCRDGKAWRLVALAAIAAAAAFSDRLFALYFPVPAFLAFGLAWLFAPGAGPRLSLRRVLLPAFSVAIGCGIGLVLLKQLPTPGVEADPISDYWTGVKAKGLVHRAEQLAVGSEHQIELRDCLVISSAGWLIVSAGYLLVLIARRLLRLGRPRVPLGVGDYLAYSLMMYAVVVGVFLVSSSGAKCLEPVCGPWGFFNRYFSGPQAVALFGWALVLAAAAGRGGVLRIAALVAPTVIAGYLLTQTFTTPRVPVRDLLSPYPRYLSVLDEICQRRGLSRGVGGYWQAKEATYFSKTGATVNAMMFQPESPNLFAPQVWLSNAYWLFPRPGEGPYQFILATNIVLPGTGDISAETIRKTFGPPAEEVTVGNIVIMVYDRPEDSAFRDLLTANPDLSRLRYRLDPRAKIRFLGGGFLGGKRHPGDGTARVAKEGDPSGCVAFGPYMIARMAGPHYAEFRLRAENAAEAPGAVDVYYSEADTGYDKVLTQLTGIPANYDNTMRLEFIVTPEMVGKGTLQFRTFYFGHGKQTLEYVDFGRFRK